MSEISAFLLRMLPYSAAALPVSLAITLIRVIHMRRTGGKISVAHEAGRALLICYCAGLAGITVLCDIFSGTASRAPQIMAVPFRTVYDFTFGKYSNIPGAFAVNIIGNIVMFIPLGFLQGLIYRIRPFLSGVLTAGCFSLCVEMLQLLEHTRVTDIDDLILNTAGGAIGALCLLLLIKTAPAFCGLFKNNDKCEDR